MTESSKTQTSMAALGAPETTRGGLDVQVSQLLREWGDLRKVLITAVDGMNATNAQVGALTQAQAHDHAQIIGLAEALKAHKVDEDAHQALRNETASLNARVRALENARKVDVADGADREAALIVQIADNDREHAAIRAAKNTGRLQAATVAAVPAIAGLVKLAEIVAPFFTRGHP